MQKLAFPPQSFRIKNTENNALIFDSARKKFVVLTPEEWVRQHCVQWLFKNKNVPKTLLNVEKQITLNTQVSKRYDVVVYKPDGSLYLLVECKAPNVIINQDVFDQIARYNMALNANYLMVTNGLQHYYCKIDVNAKEYVFLRDLPPYK